MQNERENQTKTSVEVDNISKLNVSKFGLQSKNVETDHADDGVLNIRLAPEQIEEIHSDEYSLKLFYALRIEPLSIAEVKREFPETEPGKAQSVLDRYIKVGLIHLTKENKYFSNFPENYINYSNYRYDNDLEARKDAKVFERMKEFTGNKEYWKDKSYFSMDAFYTEEQTAELKEMLKQVKLKAKLYSNENMKSGSAKGMKFRRLKFYDMTFAILFSLFVGGMGFLTPALAQAGGNDPTFWKMSGAPHELVETLRVAKLFSGGGNDPTTRYAKISALPEQPKDGGGHDPSNPTVRDDGGGHDPDCIIEVQKELVRIRSPRICKLKILLDFEFKCSRHWSELCQEVDLMIEEIVQKITSEESVN